MFGYEFIMLFYILSKKNPMVKVLDGFQTSLGRHCHFIETGSVDSSHLYVSVPIQFKVHQEHFRLFFKCRVFVGVFLPTICAKMA
jgi:hypothetical protein